MLIFQAVSVLLPILISGLVFIAAIKNHWFESLNKPIDFGSGIFGPSKNWRAVFFYVIGGTAIVGVLHWLQPHQAWIASYYSSDPLELGVLNGLAYSFGELVNSFVKRRIGMAPGGNARTKSGRIIQSVFDNIDGALASGLVLALVFHADWSLLGVAFAMSLLTHWSTDVLMRRLSLKRK
jgi:hypothetical protein